MKIDCVIDSSFLIACTARHSAATTVFIYDTRPVARNFSFTPVQCWTDLVLILISEATPYKRHNIVLILAYTYYVFLSFPNFRICEFSRRLGSV